jgi:hypothetical protein
MRLGEYYIGFAAEFADGQIGTEASFFMMEINRLCLIRPGLSRN